MQFFRVIRQTSIGAVKRRSLGFAYGQPFSIMEQITRTACQKTWDEHADDQFFHHQTFRSKLKENSSLGRDSTDDIGEQLPEQLKSWTIIETRVLSSGFCPRWRIADATDMNALLS